MGHRKQFTREEISTTTSADAVFIVDNVVYDASQFLDEHPGGHEVLVHARGKDVSEEFHDIGHSFDAKELMVKYAVGDLVPADRVRPQTRHVSWEDSSVGSEASFLGSWQYPLLTGVLLTVLYSYLFGSEEIEPGVLDLSCKGGEDYVVY